jgi:raffinose/stachyose/melibiose transport system substrate-binding protein
MGTDPGIREQETKMSIHHRRLARPAVAAAFAAALVATSAASVAMAQADPSPGGSPASAQAGPDCPGMTTEPITITYWDSANENLSDEGIATIDGEFMAAFPNVEIVRVGKSFGDILATMRLQATGSNPPDILATNGGYALLGPLVAAGLLVPLDDYAEQYGWNDEFGEAVLRQQRFSDDGKTYGVGSLWTMAPTATFIGLFVNRANLEALGLEAPTTFEELEASLVAAKEAGMTPIVQGVSEGWPAIHMFTSFQNLLVPNSELNDLVYHTAPATFDTPENVEAATIAQRFGSEGYYGDGYLGMTAQAAIDEFNAGNALYFMQGSYYSVPIGDGLGDGAEMMLVPGFEGGPFSVTGGPGVGFGISSRSANPDAAACYIDWRTGQRASELLVAEGGLPAMNFEYSGDSTYRRSLFDGWNAAVQGDALVPYIDFASTNLIDILTAKSQELVAGQVTPEQFAADVQAQYESFEP